VEAECGGVDLAKHRVRRRAAGGEHREAVRAVAVIDQVLQLIEVDSNSILTPRDLRRVSATLRDGGDADSVARRTAGLRRENHAVADA